MYIEVVILKLCMQIIYRFTCIVHIVFVINSKLLIAIKT